MDYNTIEIHWLGHAGFKIKDKSTKKIICIDPFQLSEEEEKADFIFITHSHYDHCSLEDIKKIIKPETEIIVTTDVLSKLAKITPHPRSIIVESSKEYKLKEIQFQTIPSYNINKKFHPKGNEWVGYNIYFSEGIKVYHAGDTDLISEMRNVQTDIALLPVDGTYTMNAEEAVRAATMIKPNLAIPMHWGSIIGTKEDAEKFLEGCKQKSISAQILEKNAD